MAAVSTAQTGPHDRAFDRERDRAVPAQAFRVRRLELADVPRLLARDDAVFATPFQAARWLSTWYAAFAAEPGVEPLPMLIERGRDGAPVAFVPLVRRRQGRLTFIAFADEGITDYNAPVLFDAGRALPPGAERALWGALRRALPKADVVRFEKMSPRIGDDPNPLAAVEGVRPSRLSGNIIVLGEDWEAFHRGHEKTFRKELERSWRVFTRHGDARLVRITDPSVAERVLAVLEEQQRARIAELGFAYALDRPVLADHYRRLVAGGLADGSVILSALIAGEEVVAALLGIAAGRHYAMVRLSAAGGAWKNCSPGRLVIERTMHALHGRGFRTFDFTIGSYAYKRRMGVRDIGLVDGLWAASPIGLAVVAATRIRHALAQSAFARRLRDRLAQRSPQAAASARASASPAKD